MNSDSRAVPRHVAVIMDGNGRWAAKRGLPRAAGHRRGAQAAKQAVLSALDLGIEFLTLYSFSSENWNRPADEVGDIMGLLRYTMERERADLEKQGVRLRVIGDRERLPRDILRTIEESERGTSVNSRLTAVVALSYGGRAEIARAARLIAEKAVRGEIDASAVDEHMVTQHLFTHGIPDPDLLIRTSGESRISNFLLWQMAYTEFVFADTYWPDFDRAAMDAAINEYQSRDRRFGGRRVG